MAAILSMPQSVKVVPIVYLDGFVVFIDGAIWLKYQLI